MDPFIELTHENECKYEFLFTKKSIERLVFEPLSSNKTKDLLCSFFIAICASFN